MNSNAIYILMTFFVHVENLCAHLLSLLLKWVVQVFLTENTFALMSFVALILQNFDLEKKEDHSETDEDGLKAESPESVW